MKGSCRKTPGGSQFDAALFDVDGSLRDVCVLDADIEDWHMMLRALGESCWNHSLDTGSADPINGRSAEAIFSYLNSTEDSSVRLNIIVSSIHFTCHFFDISEIEFSFDPSEIGNDIDFMALRDFMKWLARVCDKRVILTMETTDHRSIPPLIEVLNE